MTHTASIYGVSPDGAFLLIDRLEALSVRMLWEGIEENGYLPDMRVETINGPVVVYTVMMDGDDVIVR